MYPYLHSVHTYSHMHPLAHTSTHFHIYLHAYIHTIIHTLTIIISAFFKCVETVVPRRYYHSLLGAFPVVDSEELSFTFSASVVL